MIVIVNYRMGNLGSIKNMLKKIGHPSVITSDVDVIKDAQKLILPGVGAFDRAMTNLDEMNLMDILNYKVLKEKTPVLGICLGMQLLADSSEEGSLKGLGWIKGKVKKFAFNETNQKLKIPHMGWNYINPAKESALLQGLNEESKFYFVHSYHYVCDSPDDVLATAEYGYEFTSAVCRGNIFGAQFHPEKSHKYGMQLLKNYAERI